MTDVSSEIMEILLTDWEMSDYDAGVLSQQFTTIIDREIQKARIEELENLWMLNNEDCPTCFDNNEEIKERLAELKGEK